jgi:GAF domain-containing protein
MPKADPPLRTGAPKTRDSQEMLELLYAVAQDMSFRRGPAFLMDQVMTRVAKVTRVEAASLLLLNESTGRLDFEVVKGLNAQALKELDLHLSPDEGLAGWAFARNAVAIVNEPDRDPRFKAGVDWLTGFKTRNLLVAPIRLGGRPFGVLELVNRRRNEPFTDEDAELVSAIAHLLTTTLDNVRAVAALESAQAHFRALLDNLPGGYLGVDREGKVNHASARAAALLGWEESPVGKFVHEVFRGISDVEQTVARVLADGRPVLRQTAAFDNGRRGARLLGYSAFPLVAGRQGLGAGIVFQDIT